jgi:hypothetical protein
LNWQKSLGPLLITLGVAWIGFRATIKQSERNFEAQIKTALLSRNTEIDNKLLEMKLTQFIEAQVLIDQFCNCISDYCANVNNWNDRKRDGLDELLSEYESKHKVLEEQCYKAFLLLGTAESKLLFLGKKAVHQHMLSLYDEAVSIYKDTYLNTSMDEWKKDDWNNYNKKIKEDIFKLKELKRTLMFTLGKEINNEHNTLLKRN